ncbi:MAG: protein translocase subunit SecD [Planctomycetaceae bacterium]|nr:protein translocase subunit SecD [Planctomycetaceae bacterium]
MSSLGLTYSLLAQADAATQAAQGASLSAGEPTTAAPSAFGWIAIAVLVGIIVVPFLLGHFIERALKLKDVAFRIGVVLFALCIGMGPFVTNKIATGHWVEGALNWGIDLAGGTNLVYRVDAQATRALGKRVDNETMDKMREAIRNRVAPTGTEEVTVRRVGDDSIEVIVPGADAEKTEEVKRNITTLGSLEFSIVANSKEHPELIAKGEEQLSRPDEKEIRVGGVLKARWVPVAFDAAGKPKVDALDRGELIRPATVNGKDGFEILVLNEPDPRKRITGDYLVNAREEFQASGPVVGFQFNQQGGYLFQQLTWNYQPDESDPHRTKLAILLSGAVHSAPNINAVIGTNGIIEGNFTSQEIQALVSVLNAGALEVPLIDHPVNEATVSPLLGADVREQGKVALWIALISVFVVTAAYYWIPGLIADLCLLINLVLLVGIMSLIDATFTLPGLAGLVLAIGMAVDANVLIFERMREESEKGASTRMAIQNGFSKAFATIVDSNLTTLITAVVLYVIGTDAVKGFAVTLFIGIVVSMFTAVFVGRLIFDILERKRMLKSIRMANAVGTTNIDFLSKTSVMAGLSLLVIVLGLVGVFTRGADNFDIDFRGGVMVAFGFEGKQPSFEEAQQALKAKLGDDITVEQLSIAGVDGQDEQLIRLRTIDEDADRVSREIDEAFAGTDYRLVRQHVTLGELSPIAAGDADAADDQEFSGGQQTELTLSQEMLPSSVRDEVASAFKTVNTQKYGDMATLLKVHSLDAEEGAKAVKFHVSTAADVPASDVQKALEEFKSDLEAEPFFTEKNTFATSVGREMQVTALVAILFSMGAIVLYLWFRFHGATFGLAACIALVHDVLITLGAVSIGSYLSGNGLGQSLGLVDFKINLPMIAAFLTIVGYSLNDTIVVFDRIREVRGKNPRLTSEMVNLSVNQTLSRTLLTSMTTLVVVVVLYLIGGEGIHGFAYCLIIGILVGTYSSIYVASPALVWLMNREHAKPAAA